MSFIARLLKFTLLLFALCAGAYFILFNSNTVQLSFGHLGSMVLPAAVVYIVFYFLGAATVSLYFGYEFTRRSLKLGRLERKVRKMEELPQDISKETSITGSQSFS